MLKIGENLTKLQARKCICLTRFVRLGSVQLKAEEFAKQLEYNEKPLSLRWFWLGLDNYQTGADRFDLAAIGD